MRLLALLLFLAAVFTGTAQQRLHVRAIVQLISTCDSRNDCQQLEKISVFFKEKNFDLAFDLVLQRTEDCTGVECFFWSLLKAKILIEKSLIDAAVEEYLASLRFRDNHLEELGIEHYEVEQVLGTLYLRQKEHQKTISILTRWLDHNPDIPIERKTGAYHNLGVSYLHLKKYDSSEFYLKASISAKEQLNDSLRLPASYMDLANLYYIQFLDDKAIPLFIKALQEAKKVEEEKPEVLLNAYLNMAVVEENRKDFRKSLKFRKEYEKIQKKLWDRDKVWELAKKDKLFEVNKREKEIVIQEAELESQRWQINTYLSSAFFLLLISSISVWSYNKVKKTNKQVISQKEELEQLNQTKNRLFTIVAHDLKSPVLSLKKSQQQMTKAILNKDDEEILNVSSDNEKLLNKTYQLLTNTLQWAMDQADQLHLNPEPIHVYRLLEMVLYDYESFIEAKNIALTKDISEVDQVNIDVESIKVVIRNLLDNAIRFTPSGGTIDIVTLSKGDSIQLIIEDSGTGIEENHLRLLFSSKILNNTPDTEGHKGTGLGLMISKSFVEQNSGVLSIASEKGKGTCITIDFPKYPIT